EATPPSAAALAQARARADRVATRYGVPRIDAVTLAQWRADATRTTYLFDVRTQTEHLAGHLPGATWAIGVQLVQCLDQWAAVRGARLVLVDHDGVRATLTAHWLRQLGWDAVAFTPGGDTALETGSTPTARTTLVAPRVGAQDAHTQGRLLLDASPSAQFREAHAAGARWVNRSRLGGVRAAAQAAGRVAVLAHDDGVADLIAQDLADVAEVAVVTGGLAAWRAAGLPVDASPHEPPDADRIDHLFWLHDRHDGNAASSAAYLQWEERLPATIGDPTRAGFRLAHGL
ncbi:rhodanese-like domain-containing protein, partial [Hydrogenophaga sp.]|uniref:rhodanese-like domain-containing protein n=1 Tax=Hydrogenophaga sp. TaxID=1904254 RepID=UPI00271DBF51